MEKPQFQEEKFDSIPSKVKESIVLLVTATDTETAALHNNLKSLPGYKEIICVYEGTCTYFLGIYGKYAIVHVQCTKGSTDREGSITTVSTAISTWKPKFVLMLGIAFGVENEKQRIGDILIADAILPYNNKRVGAEKTIHRSPSANPDKVLVNRFRNMKSWAYQLEKDRNAELILGHILSGDEVVDNIERRSELVVHFPSANGGEMEGAGVYAACDGVVPWMLVKAICDYGDGLKKMDKAKNQKIAIDSVINYALAVFSQATVFEELGVYATDFLQKEINKKDANNALFDIYDITKEPYYVKRNSDKTFIQSVNSYGIWLHGISGCGKSNIIIRNLIFHKLEYLQLNLGLCIEGESIESYFTELLYQLGSLTPDFSSLQKPLNFQETSKAIITLLESHYGDKHLILFIEEIPISDLTIQEKFVERMYSLIIAKSKFSCLNGIKFVLSSIKSPEKYIKPHQQKIHEQIKFIELGKWDESDVENLVNVVIEEIPIILSEVFRKKLIVAANGSPRFVKKFFGNILSIAKFDETTMNLILQDTARELIHS